MAENGGPSHTHGFWLTNLPRAFHSVPATRHLITAIGILESSIGCSDPTLINVQCQRIHHNYSLALRALMQPDLHQVDLALAPFLAWLLDTLMLRDKQADVHAKALEKMTAERALSNMELSSEELGYVISCVQRTQGLRRHVDIEMPLPQVLAIRSHVSTRATPQEILQAFQNHFETFDVLSMTLEDFRNAEAFIEAHYVTIHGNVYHSGGPMVIFTALHYMCAVSMAILNANCTLQWEMSKEHEVGLDFVLDQFEDMLTRVMIKRSDQLLLDSIVSLALSAMSKYTPAMWRRSRKGRLIGALSTVEGRPTSLEHGEVAVGVERSWRAEDAESKDRPRDSTYG